jgi:hypothetical protein
MPLFSEFSGNEIFSSNFRNGYQRVVYEVECRSFNNFEFVLNWWESSYYGDLRFAIGSRVFGTETPESDWDFLAIVKEGTKTTNLIETDGTSLSMYEPAEFQKVFSAYWQV